ncbi:MAG TPA: zf-HC2 domain-containing protein, partial [Candidatus Polarisedimenticolia bacterium]|nr:zf-HC2 domain-containing protein [Candidatus Polarisedimenticolia bacterium]
MRDCEQHEIRISAWMDEELDREGQEAMLDHLVRCPGCRDFYLGARGLAGLAAAIRTQARAPAPSPEVWRLIERSARSSKIARRSGRVALWTRRVPMRGWAVAA